MIAKIKKWGIYAVVCLFICGAMFTCGYVVRWKQSPTITVSQQGEIIERTNIIYKPIDLGADNPCADISRNFNSLLNDYKFFLNATPEVYDVTDSRIRFKLATQKYSLSYHYTERPRWSITPYGTIRCSITPGVTISYGGGLGVEWGGITGLLLIDSMPSLTIGAGYRIVMPW